MIVEIPVGKSRYKVTCEESETERLLFLAEKLNQRINALALQMKYTDEKTLLVIGALMIEEELDQATLIKSELTDDDVKLNDEDVRDAVSESMENIASYIEKLTTKIQNF